MNVETRAALEKKGIWLNIGSVLAMSSSPVLDKLALSSIAPVPAVVVVYSYNAIFSLISVRKKVSRAFIMKLLMQRWLLFMGGINALALIMLFQGLDLTDPVSVGFLRRFYVVFALLMSSSLLGERFTRLEAMVTLVSAVGAFIFVSEGKLPVFQSIVGSGLIILSSALFAYANLLAKRHVNKLSTMELMALNNWLVLFFVTAYSLLRHDFPVDIEIESIILLGFSALLSSFIGLALFYAGLRYVSYWKANILRSLEPLVVTLYSLPFFPQTITWARLMGGGLLVAGVLILIFLARPQEEQQFCDQVKN
jgi:drug/metabolite transporter (DMT)-like permease